MSIGEVGTAIAAIVTAIGGAGLVFGLIAKWLADLLSKNLLAGFKAGLDRDLESHKARLIKSRVLFEHELAAAQEFAALRRTIKPRYRHPDMDWNEACENVVENFDETEKHLRDYLAKNGPLLQECIVDKIETAAQIASNHKFDNMHGSVNDDTGKAVEKFLAMIDEVNKEISAELRSQTTI